MSGQKRDKASGLYIALKGPAADIVYNTPGAEDLSFQELCSLLEARYGVERRLTADKRALKKRTKQKGETYNALGDDISRLARCVYKDSPGLAEREGKDAYIQALPMNLRLPVAAANPQTVQDCMEVVERLCSVVETTRKVRRVNQNSRYKEGGKTESANAGAEKKECPELWCWDCGQHGHVRTSCPEHFKFKLRGGRARPPQQAGPSAPSRAEPMQAETSPKEEGNESRPQ